jgi:hypothetical protein
LGSITPKRFRNKHDTAEISALLKPQEYPIGGLPFFPIQDRFKTQASIDYKLYPNDKTKSFGPDDARLIRSNIESQSPKFCLENPDYIKL